MRFVTFLSLVLTAVLSTDSGAAEPSGPWITFVSQRSGKNLLYRMRPDGSERSAIFGGELKDQPGLSEGMTLYREPHWGRLSPDRKYFIDWAADVGLPLEKYNSPIRFMLFLGRLDGGPVRALIPDGEESFAWSPDSKRIAYAVVSGRRNEVAGLTSPLPSTKIFIVGLDGGNEELVLEKSGIWNVLDWSPDGKKLLLGYTSAHSLAYAFHSLHEFDLVEAQRVKKEASAKDYTFGLFYPASQQIDAHLKLLSGHTQVSDGRYAPDGQAVAVIFTPQHDAYTPRFELGLISQKDLKLKPVLKAPGVRGPICWSPDGKEILYSRRLAPADEAKEKIVEINLGIYAVGTEGKGERFLTAGWSPDWR